MYSDEEMISAWAVGVISGLLLVAIGLAVLLATGHLHIYKELYCIW